MAADYEYMEETPGSPVFLEVLAAGTDISELPDIDEDNSITSRPALRVFTLDNGALVETSKARIIELLEGALRQARGLPDDE